MRIALLVEDELLIREVAREYLVEAGFDVTLACDGSEALRLMREGRGFDLLFTDIKMPGEIGGRDLARQAKGLVTDLKIIFATGYHDSDEPLANGETLLKKPYHMGSLRAALSQLGFCVDAGE